MNKQEAIDKIESKKILDNFITNYGVGYNEALDDTIDIINQLEEPVKTPEPKPLESEKPVVPRFVADWVEWCKKNNVTLLGAMSPIDELGTAICDDKKVESLDASEWATRNQETFAKAWLYGCDVEKEKLYTVEIPNPNAGGHVVLCKTSDGIASIAFTGKARWQGCKNFQLTEAEIKKDFEWAFRWAKEAEDEY